MPYPRAFVSPKIRNYRGRNINNPICPTLRNDNGTVIIDQVESLVDKMLNDSNVRDGLFAVFIYTAHFERRSSEKMSTNTTGRCRTDRANPNVVWYSFPGVGKNNGGRGTTIADAVVAGVLQTRATYCPITRSVFLFLLTERKQRNSETVNSTCIGNIKRRYTYSTYVTASD